MACSACFHGCTLTDTARLHIKESDRGKVLAEELEKFGIHSDVYDNKVVVHPGTLRAPTVPYRKSRRPQKPSADKERIENKPSENGRKTGCNKKRAGSL